MQCQIVYGFVYLNDKMLFLRQTIFFFLHRKYEWALARFMRRKQFNQLTKLTYILMNITPVWEHIFMHFTECELILYINGLLFSSRFIIPTCILFSTVFGDDKNTHQVFGLPS